MADWGVRVLALDLSSHTGWACGDVEREKPRAGTFDLPQNRGGSDGPRWKWFVDHLTTLIELERVELVVYEAPVPGNRFDPNDEKARQTNFDALKVLGSLTALTEYVVEKQELTCFAANIQAVRKHFIGVARPEGDPKLAVRERCRELGVSFRNHNEADAIAILSYALHQIEQAPAWSRVPLRAAA